MLYQLLKIPAQLALHLYCRNIRLNNPSILNMRGPLLIAANHPNSFLDAIILSSLFKRPVYSLARGDAFTNQLTSKILGSLNILPVYRMSEGAENLGHNYHTFSRCREIFKQNGIVLIFSEGRCINEWKLRPLKKGTARLAISSREEGIDLTILPTGINYHSFEKFGKNIHLQFGNPFKLKDISSDNGYGKTIQDFNAHLQQELSNLVIEIDPDDLQTKLSVFSAKHPKWKNALLTLPAIAGWVLHAPLYYPVKWITRRFAHDSGHYDSIVVGLLFLLYPIYLSAITLLAVLYLGSLWYLLIALLLPFTAWAYVQRRERF